MDGFGLNDWIAVASALFAVASFVLNWMVVSRQTAMQYESLRAQTDAEMIRWADAAIDVLGDAISLARGRGSAIPLTDVGAQQLAVLNRLSATIDKGRLFFPNIAPAAKGGEKEGAFKGFRPPILDCLVFAFFWLERLETDVSGPDEAAAGFFMKCRRVLVSEVQRATDPRRRSRMLRELAESGPSEDPEGFAEVAALAEELDRKHPDLLEEKRDAAWVAQMKELAAARRRKAGL